MFSDPKDILRQCGISAGMIVGDFGTGAGAFAREAASYVGPAGVVYAFDVQKHFITALAALMKREKDSVIRPLWADLEHEKGSGLADNTLDLAIVANVLFQIEDKRAFLTEVARVLRPSGRLLLVDWQESFGHTGPHPNHVVNENAARALLDDVGLTFDKTITAGAHHYGLISRKRTTDDGR